MSTIKNTFKKAGRKKEFDVWVSQKLTLTSLLDRICKILQKRNEIELFSTRFITANQKRVAYDNDVQIINAPHDLWQNPDCRQRR